MYVFFLQCFIIIYKIYLVQYSLLFNFADWQSSSPCSLAGWDPSHLVASTFIVNVLHFPLSSAVVFQTWLFVPALSRSRLTQSFHRSFGLPLLLLSPSSAFLGLFDSLSSPILCPAYFMFCSTLGVFHANIFSQFLHLPSIFLGYFPFS